MKKHDFPYQQWYWGDWFKAMDVQSLPKDIRDTWFTMIGRMFESEKRGYLQINGKRPDDEEMCGLLGFGNIGSLNPTLKGGVILEMLRHYNYLRDKRIFSETESGIPYCRRIVKDEENRINSIKYGNLGGNPKLKRVKGRDKGGVNPPLIYDIDSDNDSDSVPDSLHSLDARCLTFKKQVLIYKSEYREEMLEAFFQYWSEPNPSKTKARWELQKTWDTSRRLKTWADREKNDFNKTEPQKYNAPVLT